MKDDPVIEAKEPAPPKKFVGMVVEFDLHREGGKVTRERGEVIEQRWLGVTQRGHVPEYEVTVRGRTGRAAKARVSRDHVMPI